MAPTSMVQGVRSMKLKGQYTVFPGGNFLFICSDI